MFPLYFWLLAFGFWLLKNAKIILIYYSWQKCALAIEMASFCLF
jgi:hypothetical protein